MRRSGSQGAALEGRGFFELIESRHSTRVFANRPVEQEKLDLLFQAANAAPSAANYQAYEIFVVTKVRHRATLSQAAGGQSFVLTAPASLVFCAHPDRNRERFGERGACLLSVQDATIACAYAQLAAASIGLGSCWVGSFDEAAVRRIIGVGEELRPVAMLAVGYAAGEPELRERRPVGELVHPVE